MLTAFDNLGSLGSEARSKSVTLPYFRIRGSGFPTVKVDILEGNDLIRIRIRVFLGLPDPQPDPLATSTDPDPAPATDPSIIKKK
jgi:hypothetical protein